MTTMTGTINTTELAGVRIHTYTSPEDGMLVNTQIIEGPTRLVVFDSQFFVPYAQEVVSYIKLLEKPVERIVISHSHPDHWAALEILARELPRVPIYALAEVQDFLATQGQAFLDTRRAALPKIGNQAVAPDHVLAEGRQVIDGVTYEFRKYFEGEADVQLVVLLPDQRVLLSFDLVFPGHLHAFTVAPFFGHWLDLLQELEHMDGYDHILVGHGPLSDRSAIVRTREFVQEASRIHQTASNPEEYAQQLIAAFPDRQQAFWSIFSSQLLYSQH